MVFVGFSLGASDCLTAALASIVKADDPIKTLTMKQNWGCNLAYTRRDDVLTATTLQQLIAAEI